MQRFLDSWWFDPSAAVVLDVYLTALEIFFIVAETGEGCSLGREMASRGLVRGCVVVGIGLRGLVGKG